jgi:hypothetical protein
MGSPQGFLLVSFPEQNVKNETRQNCSALEKILKNLILGIIGSLGQKENKLSFSLTADYNVQ